MPLRLNHARRTRTIRTTHQPKSRTTNHLTIPTRRSCVPSMKNPMKNLRYSHHPTIRMKRIRVRRSHRPKSTNSRSRKNVNRRWRHLKCSAVGGAADDVEA
jgi:hypothetical protein